jgi:hypothetical protein
MILLRWTKESLASKKSEESAAVTDMLLQDHLSRTAHPSAVLRFVHNPFQNSSPAVTKLSPLGAVVAER